MDEKPRSKNRMDEAYWTKYHGSPYLNPIIAARARSATIKIVPREATPDSKREINRWGNKVMEIDPLFTGNDMLPPPKQSTLVVRWQSPYEKSPQVQLKI